MAMKVAATYADGAFAPDNDAAWDGGDKVWLDINERFAAFLPADSPLAAAEREFIAAFANGGWDEARARQGCLLAWEATRDIVAKALRARGLTAATDVDILFAMKKIDKTESRGNSNERLSLYPLFRAVELFRDRSSASDCDAPPFSLGEIWQFTLGLEMASDLIAAMEEGSGEGAAWRGGD